MSIFFAEFELFLLTNALAHSIISVTAMRKRSNTEKSFAETKRLVKASRVAV